MKQLDRIEWKLDTILQKLSETTPTQASVSKPINAEERPEVVLHPFTTKQHCTIQMLCRGASNKEIGDRLRITENSAKVHVRTICKKLGVNTRGQIILKLIDALKEIDDESYRLLAGGIPKDWDTKFAEDGDAYEHLIHGENDGSET